MRALGQRFLGELGLRPVVLEQRREGDSFDAGL
jgi:hypothetical protein